MAQILSPVRLATAENIDLSTGLSVGNDRIDGVTLNVNDRILVKSQTDRVENGIYYVHADTGILTRTSDFLVDSAQVGGTIIFIQEGDSLADTGWVISSDGTMTVGQDNILFEKFSNNFKLASYDVASSIILRSEKGYPLTIAELDNNFKYLSTTLDKKLNIVDFNATNIVDKINSLSASEASLDAWDVRGHAPDITSQVNTLALRDESGDLYTNVFHGDLAGNAATADLADYATLANNVDGIVAVLNGGTGGSTAAAARANLNVVNRAGDSMTGKLVLPAAAEGFASLNIPPRLAETNNPVAGDIWTTTSNIQYRLNGLTQTVAPLSSPNFVDAPTAPTPSKTSNSTALATTAFVQDHVADLNASIDLKANIASPTLTGTPNSTTPLTNDNSTRIATTAYTVARLAASLASYSTTAETNAAIATALANYYTKAETNGRISTELANYYTKAQIDTTLGNYYTKSETDTRISNAVAVKANTSYVDGIQDKWGTSRKFVQSTAPTGASNGDFWFKV